MDSTSKSFCESGHNYMPNNERGFLFCFKCGSIVPFPSEYEIPSKQKVEIEYVDELITKSNSGHQNKKITLKVHNLDKNEVYSFKVYKYTTNGQLKELLKSHCKFTEDEISLLYDRNYSYVCDSNQYETDYDGFLLFTNTDTSKFIPVTYNNTLYSTLRGQTFEQLRSLTDSKSNYVFDDTSGRKIYDTDILTKCQKISDKQSQFGISSLWSSDDCNVVYLGNDYIKGLLIYYLPKEITLIDFREILKKDFNALFVNFYNFNYSRVGENSANDEMKLVDLFDKDVIIYFETNQLNRLQVFCKTLTGKTITLDINGDSNVLTLKRLIKDKERIPSDLQRILFGGKQLEDYIKIDNYKIKEYCILDLVLRLSGDKPVIYFEGYNENETIQAKLKLDTNYWNFTYMYPMTTNTSYEVKGIAEWTFTSKGQGILSQSSGKEYSYIFWEAEAKNQSSLSFFYDKLYRDQEVKYCIKTTDFDEKLETILRNQGLSLQMTYDFMTYWKKQMTSKSYLEFTFMSSFIYNEIANLSVEPKPDEMVRVFMLFNPTDQPQFKETTQIITLKESVKEDKSKMKRVVEWGAMNLSG